jgi:phosphate transport system permease protein
VPMADRTAFAGRPRWGERVILGLLLACSGISILTTVGIVGVLIVDGTAFFREVGLDRFFGSTVWQPFGGLERGNFGVWPLVAGTLLITLIAIVVAGPLGLGAAIYLSEYAPARARRILKPALEVLAGVPTVVLGVFALNYVTPLLQTVFGDTVNIFNAASAGIVVGIMIIPTIASLSEDALSAVPQGLREGAFGLGATRRQVALRTVLPAALSGVVAAFILGIGRAIGETMIVAIAAGASPNFTLDPFAQIQTMTAYIVQAVQGETPRGSLTYQSIFAVGALLFVMTFSLNLLAQRIVRRYREVY